MKRFRRILQLPGLNQEQRYGARSMNSQACYSTINAAAPSTLSTMGIATVSSQGSDSGVGADVLHGAFEVMTDGVEIDHSNANCQSIQNRG